MEGIALAAQREQEGQLWMAWHIAAFSGAAQCGKLKKLSHYIKPKQKKAQTPDEILAALMAFQAKGAGMTIKRVN